MTKENPVHPQHARDENARHTKNASALKTPDPQNESAGRIKRQWMTDITIPEKDLPRGSEPETRSTSGRR